MTTFRRIYKYNLKSSTHEEFDRLVKLNTAKAGRVSQHPIKKNLEQLSADNVLTIEGYYDARLITSIRTTVYKFAKVMNLKIETTFSKEKGALLVRLKRETSEAPRVNFFTGRPRA